MSSPSRIIRFYLGSEPDDEGRTFAGLWQWTRSQLDAWPTALDSLFPIPEGSFLGGGIPLDADDISQFKSNPTLQANARKSFAWFASIIGLSIDADGTIAEGPSFPENFNPDNSVTVRWIRRVLWFLKAIGFDDDARRLLDWLDKETASGQFPRTVVAAWRKRIGPASD